ncbi:MAG: ATP-dependent DNA helicase RecG [Lachnospira sp.]
MTRVSSGAKASAEWRIIMDIIQLKGIGEKTAVLLNRLSVYTTDDLVGLYPRDYDVYEEPVFVNTAKENMENTIVSIDGMVSNNVEVYRHGKLTVISVFIKDVTGERIKCTWYNMPFLKSSLRQGMRYIFRGYLRKKNGIFLLEQPEMYTMEKYSQLKGSMQPIYPLTKGLSNKIVVKAVKQVLERYDTSLDMEFIPSDIRKNFELSEHNYAVMSIHFPKSMQDYMMARKRLAFEEFFLFILAMRTLKNTKERLPNSFVINNDARTDEFINNLPFKLTNAQIKVWEEVKLNMGSDKLMSRLIQGDVGCGKTIIAVLALMNTAFNGYQAAMMVPTEVLAKQQYKSVCDMFEKYNIALNISLLTGSMTQSAKKKEYERIKSGETDIIIGTHCLIQDSVEYKNLALVITDEQHRFGVNQRKTFSKKGDNPHILVMSATPIPRTLAIILYGDLDISIVDELPLNRLPIKNCVVDENYRPNAYKFIQNQINEGRQVYIICPLVEESDGIEAENVIDYAAKLKKFMQPQVRIDYLHGKMSGSQKNDIMERFVNKETDILVSTTVIEVGVNVPNATVMMVENAQRFGLAQLHQLRGRVGRGKYQSYCIFVSDNKSKKTKERLEILNKSNDGFVIAEEDLRLRGPGDFFGIRQSGEFDFGIADIYADANVLKMASDAAAQLLKDDPLIEKEENLQLSYKVKEYTLDSIEKLNL